MSNEQPLQPELGDYVLATKYSDGDPGDPWALGFYAGLDASGERHIVKDGSGQIIRGAIYRRVGRITVDIGNWLWANKYNLEQAPSKISLWGMYDWVFVNEMLEPAND